MIYSLLLVGMVSLVTLYEVKKEVDVIEAFEKENKTMIRYGEPNKYDQAPHGTELLVFRGKDNFELYQQISKDQENPIWVSRGHLSKSTNHCV